MKKTLPLLFLFFFSCFNAFADTIFEINTKAYEMIQKYEYKKSYDFLKLNYEQKNFDNQTLFLLAQTSKELGKFDESISYFQELIKNGGGTGHVRYELASAYMNKGEYDKARKELKLAKADNPPQEKLQNINLVLHQTKPWRLSANVGYMYDSNANVGTNASQILLFNLPFTLSRDAKQTSDTALVSRFGLEHKKQFSKSLSLYSSIGLGNTQYKTLSNFDLLSVNAQSGLVLEKGKFTYSLPVIANILKVGHTDDYYNYTYGVAPSISTKLTKNILFDNQFIIQQREYKTYTSRTGHNLTYRPSFKYLFSNKHYLGVGGMFGRDSVQSEVYSNTAMGVNLEYFNQFTEHFGLYVSPFFSNISYNAKENAFNEIRNDNLYSLYSMLTYKIKAYHNIEPTISLTHSYTQNNSNIDLYSYKRHQVSLNFGIRY